MNASWWKIALKPTKVITTACCQGNPSFWIGMSWNYLELHWNIWTIAELDFFFHGNHAWVICVHHNGVHLTTVSGMYISAIKCGNLEVVLQTNMAAEETFLLPITKMRNFIITLPEWRCYIVLLVMCCAGILLILMCVNQFVFYLLSAYDAGNVY